MRYFKNILWAAFAWLFSGIIIHIPSFFISGVLHPALCEWFPSVFVDYSPVSQSEQYAVLSSVLTLLNSSATVFIISYFCVRLDNERMEYMIARTEGFYTLGEGMSLYFGRYLKCDLAVALTVPIPLAVADVFIPAGIPEPFATLVADIFSFTRGYTELLGTAPAIIVMCISVLAFRLLSGVLSLRAWQAAWLSETG